MKKKEREINYAIRFARNFRSVLFHLHNRLKNDLFLFSPKIFENFTNRLDLFVYLVIKITGALVRCDENRITRNKK